MISLSKLIAADPTLKPANQYELEIIHTIASQQKMFQLYKDSGLIEKIKKVVPITDLTNKCSRRMVTLQSSKSKDNFDNNQRLESRDVFFLLLLEWFKSDFFSWFDCSYCQACEKPMKLAGRSPPNQEESLWDASNVEVYRCDNCFASERFPRYNHPMKLLETRKGRCGEWRNCFSAICVAFNYEIRLTNDFQDHVWNEVYLESQRRWLHLDCCENAFDTPLMYESGWGKKLIYVIGTSEYDCQDVTMRYTRDYISLLNRRKGRCRPDWLNRYLLYASIQFQKNCSQLVKTKLLHRRFDELASMVIIPGVERELKDSEKQGRSSGSMNWRMARGECSSTTSQSANYIIKFNGEGTNGTHRFTYSSINDKYLIDGTSLSKWSSAAFHYENIFKKTENDWKMTYLSRLENSDCAQKGVLMYKFKINFDWTLMTIKVDSKVYETGVVTVKLTSEPEHVNISLNLDDVNIVTKSDHDQNIDYLLLTITLSGGLGNIGWQQAQIFRQSIKGQQNDASLDIVFS